MVLYIYIWVMLNNGQDLTGQNMIIFVTIYFLGSFDKNAPILTGQILTTHRFSIYIYIVIFSCIIMEEIEGIIGSIEYKRSK